MLKLFTAASWLSLVFYAYWLFGRAKQPAPLTPKEVYILWNLHKQKAQCNSLIYIWKFHKKKGIVGFKCLCGYKYESQRPII